MHISNVTSRHTSLHTKGEKKRYRGLFSMLHCSLPLSTKILQSCGVILQNVPLISAQVLNKYMYFVHNYRSASVCVCVPITEASDLSVSSLFTLPQSLLYIFAFACALSCTVYHLYNEFLQKFKTCKSRIFSRHH